jgi:hypothetical protein
MSNVFDDVREALSRADDAQRAVDMEARKMAALIKNRLQATEISHQVYVPSRKSLRDTTCTLGVGNEQIWI